MSIETYPQLLITTILLMSGIWYNNNMLKEIKQKEFDYTVRLLQNVRERRMREYERTNQEISFGDFIIEKCPKNYYLHSLYKKADNLIKDLKMFEAKEDYTSLST